MFRQTAACIVFFSFAAALKAGEEFLLLEDGRIVEGVDCSWTEVGVTAHFINGDLFIPEGLIKEAVLDEQRPGDAMTEEQEQNFAKGMVRYDGRWMSKSRRDTIVEKQLEERREQIELIRKQSLWRNRHIEKTRHFEFESTVPPHIFERFRDLMEAYYDEFKKTWRISQPRSLGRLKVCFYADREAFHQISGAPRGVAGYYRFVEPMELDIYYDRRDLEFTEQVMYHEAGHYLQKLIRPEFKVPHFPGEALAEYYGASKFDPETNELEVGLILESRLTQIKDDLTAGKKIGLEQLITTDGMFEHYTWGWSLVHFLMQDKKQSKDFKRFFLDLIEGDGVKHERSGWGLITCRPSEVWQLFKDRMRLRDDEDVRELEQIWHEYVEENLSFVTAKGYEKAAFAAADKYPPRPIRAKRLFETAIQMGSVSAVAYHRYGKLLADEDEQDKALELWQKSLELDPLNGEVYYSMAKVLRKQGQRDEASRLAKLAVELEPADTDLEIRVENFLEDLAE